MMSYIVYMTSGMWKERLGFFRCLCKTQPGWIM